MIDIKLLRNNPEKVRESLKVRHDNVSLVDAFLEKDKILRKVIFEIDNLKAKRNESSKRIGEAKKAGKNVDEEIKEMHKVNAQIKELEENREEREATIEGPILLSIPNIPHHTVPIGTDSSDNLEIRRVGKPPQFAFAPKHHYDIGEKMGIFNFEQGAKIAGSRFVVLKDLGARLERALINFMLDLQVKENGYTEVLPPFLVNQKAMYGTGQLPKFSEDLYSCSDNMWLVPTAEVPVTNLHSNEIMKTEDLPVKYCAYTPCFRREAGSYGKDVRGLIRQHQFNKVELVKFVQPEKSYEELESLTADAEKVLQRLGLQYRVVALCTGDLGFAAAKTYDLEVWFPAEGRFREISSCSNFEDFQARRAQIRFRRSPKAKPEFVHTLNGSGLAIGRTFAAIIENYQKEDGTFEIPEALKDYL